MDRYQRGNAVAYAQRWALSRNPAFFAFDALGGDCTNFVSQCLHAGGARMNTTRDFGWYYRNAGSKAPAWTGVEYLYQFFFSNRRPGFKVLETGPAGMEEGDVIQLSFDGEVFSHSLLVTKTSESELYIATHSFDSLDRPLSTYVFQKARYLHIEGLV